MILENIVRDNDKKKEQMDVTELSPYEGSTVEEIPAALYFQIVVSKLNMSDYRSILVLILVERLIQAQREERSKRFFKSDMDTECNNVSLNSFSIHR